MNRTLQTLSPETFAPYGRILQFTEQMSDGWEILITSESPGWRIALLEFDRRSTQTLEHHPHSKESFEPLSGTSLLIVAPYESPDQYEIFLLDQPICLNEKVWHQVISLSDQTKVKITENLEVDCVYHQLATEITPMFL
jgi:ureidoglycolate hydrolase